MRARIPRLNSFYAVAVVVVAVTLVGVAQLWRDVSRIEAALPVESLHRERDFSALLFDVGNLEWALRLAAARPDPQALEQLSFHLDLAYLRQRDNRALYHREPGPAAIHAALAAELDTIDGLLRAGPSANALAARIEPLARLRARVKEFNDAGFQASMEQASAQRVHLSGHRHAMLALLAILGVFGLGLVVLLLRQKATIGQLRAVHRDLRLAAATVEADNRLRAAVNAVQNAFFDSTDADDRPPAVLREAMTLTGSRSGIMVEPGEDGTLRVLCARDCDPIPETLAVAHDALAAGTPEIRDGRMAVPVHCGSQVAAVMVLGGRPGGYGLAEAEMVAPLVGACGTVLAVQRARDAELRARDRLAVQAEELSRSNADLEQFAYVVSHDLRQPLRMVTSFTQLLRRRIDGMLDDEARELMAFVSDGAARMDEMLVSLLEYSRVGRKGEPMAVVDVRTAAEEALRFLTPALEEAGATVTLEGAWPRVHACGNELTRLFQNLIGNAVKFRSPDRAARVTVAVARRGGDWLFRVADNGIGIAPEQFDRLFKVFQRLNPPGSYEGTGIGLAECRKIVERHGGRIWAESGGEGTGCRFCFTLPAALPAPERDEES